MFKITPETEDMAESFRFLIFLQVVLFSFTAWMVGCGGSSIENPVQESDADGNTTTPPQSGGTPSLNVKVNVSEAMVRPGEGVQLTATVDGVQGFRILLNWINVTEHGTLSVTSPNGATWVAPDTLGADDVRLEVIQFVVTVLSRVVSVRESGIDTDTQITTETKTVLLTVTAT